MRHMDTDILPPPLDWCMTKDRICDFLDNILHTTQARGFVLGLSGGVDSATVAHLAAERHADKTLALIMPDSAVTPDSETNDGRLVAQSLHIKFDTIRLDDIMDVYARSLEGDKHTLGNLRARVRATILYHYANSNNLLVLGSTDRSEYLLGYYTKFGDAAADAVPIIELYKTQVRELASYMGVQLHIVDKKSSPHLWPDHDAEDELGAPYDVIDRILYGTGLGMSAEDCARRTHIPIHVIHHITDIMQKNHHKMEGPLHPPES